jgi:transposase
MDATLSSPSRRSYPSDVSDEEWAFVAPYLSLLSPLVPQRLYPLREVFNALRWLVRTGSPWRYVPHDLPPWAVVYQQTQRWLKAGVFEALVDDLRGMLRELEGRRARPTAMVLDARTLRSTPESGERAGHDAHKKTRGAKVHVAVDTLGHLLALVVTPADAQDRTAIGALADQVAAHTGERVSLAFVDESYRGPQAADAARAHGLRLAVVKLPALRQGFVLLPRRWVVERSFAWLTRFRRLAKDYERLPATLAGLHFVAFACLLLTRTASMLGLSP